VNTGAAEAAFHNESLFQNMPRIAHSEKETTTGDLLRVSLVCTSSSTYRVSRRVCIFIPRAQQIINYFPPVSLALAETAKKKIPLRVM
jgi:hypothetical protein